MFELLHMKHVIFCLSLVVAIAAAPSRAASFQARVVSVADGDSFTALDADNRQVEIRLYGISCPEKNQPYGNRARQATADAVMGKAVNVHPIGTDRSGRAVALVAAPGREMLNSWLVKEGLAWVCHRFCTRADICDRLRDLERAARAGKTGLWADGEPVELREWGRDGRK